MSLFRYTDGWTIAGSGRGAAEARAIEQLAERLAIKGARPRALCALRLKPRGCGFGVLADVICDDVKRDAGEIAAELRRLQLANRGTPVEASP